VEVYEQAWEEALAQEHLHQRELLATLRDELGAFAGECAAALNSLDAIGVTAIGEVTGAISNAYRHAQLAGEVARRVPVLAPTGAPADELLTDLYARLGREKPAPALLRHAAELARTDHRRSDGELLRAAVQLEAIPERLAEALGPALTTSLEAIEPLAKWVPTFVKLRRREVSAEEALSQAGRDVTEILQVLAGRVEEAAAAVETVALADALRETVHHVDAAARAVEKGKLEQVLAEARRTLDDDLGRLASVIHGANAPGEWLDARKSEHAALVTEVEQKLERVERVRRVLAAILPRLQLVSRALTAAARLEAVENRLDPDAAGGGVAARMELLIALSGLWNEVVTLAEGPAVSDVEGSGSRRKLVVAALVVLALAGGTALAIALTLGGSSSKKTALTTTTTRTTASTPTTTTPATTATTAKPAAPPPRPVVSPVTALFNPVQRETVYSVTATALHQGTPSFSWRLTPPPGNAGCNKFAPAPGHPNEAVWHHADTDGCTHIGIQHAGWVYATVTTDAWVCTQRFFGTLSRTGARDERCQRA
jgi:hypothetical protein